MSSYLSYQTFKAVLEWCQSIFHACVEVVIGEPAMIFGFDSIHVDKTASRFCVNPNMVKISRATFFRSEKVVSETVWRLEPESERIGLDRLSLEVNLLHLKMHSIYPFKVLCDFFAKHAFFDNLSIGKWLYLLTQNPYNSKGTLMSSLLCCECLA